MSTIINLTPIQILIGLLINAIFTGVGTATGQYIFTKIVSHTKAIKEAS